ncbi:MAG: hypothetical protein RL026_87 [Pseudomonadota bacterium]
MNLKLPRAAALPALALSLALPLHAAAPPPDTEAQALALAREVIALRSVQGPGNQTAEVARAFAKVLQEGGWQARDIEIVPHQDAAYLIATWPGSDPALKPLVISAHMDVVEARPEDWQRDPFTPVVENGFLYGRGSSDVKFDASLAVMALVDLRRQGFRPRRSVIVAYSGDEETTMATSQLIARRLADAHMVLNVDGGGGTLSEADGTPLYWSWQGAEKTYADFQIEVTNAGGHSSMPRSDNAISQLAAAVARIGAHHFTPELNDLTRGYFREAARFQTDPKIAAAMRAFATDPADAAAIAVLRADPANVGRIGTTCVPTLLSGGHATNALPQRATANINCRIFPGHTPAGIMAELQRVAAEPAARFSDVTEGSVATAASPLREDVVAALSAALQAARPGVPHFPSQASGASDSMWYRALGIPSYGVSAQFIKDSDDYSHGLNERVPLSNLAPSLVFYRHLFSTLAR